MEKIKNCGTCADNEDGFCDRKGILVTDEDTCSKWNNPARPEDIKRMRWLKGK